jgi:hypothetical protein
LEPDLGGIAKPLKSQQIAFDVATIEDRRMAPRV